MSEMAALLGDSFERLLDQHCPIEAVARWEKGKPLGGAWEAIVEMGLPPLLVAEAAGGAGGDLEDAALVARLAGHAFLPLPLSETLVGNELVAAAGLPPPSGPIALVLGDGGSFPWSDDVESVVAVREGRVELFAAGAVTRAPSNLAGEARGTLPSDLEASCGSNLPKSFAGEVAFGRCALLRAAQIVGAMERVLSMTIGHAAEREQFGRPLNRFQAVEQQLVRAAGEVAAARIAVAAAAFSRGEDLFEIAIAKARASEAAGKVASVAHQLHGAIGFTRDLPLNLGTRRLWAWREEYGSDAYWQEWLGRKVAHSSSDALWPSLTRMT